MGEGEEEESFPLQGQYPDWVFYLRVRFTKPQSGFKSSPQVEHRAGEESFSLQERLPSLDFFLLDYKLKKVLSEASSPLRKAFHALLPAQKNPFRDF